MKQSKKESSVFDSFLDEYITSAFNPPSHTDKTDIVEPQQKKVDINKEQKLISNFLSTPCSCGKNCQDKFSEIELFDARDEFRFLSKNEKNCFILAQLRSIQRVADQAKSARTSKVRERQKFEYRINSDRYVCREAFLFYYGETDWRLKYLQKHLKEIGTTPPTHGNKGRMPDHAFTEEHKINVKQFIINFAVIHGMPDPGRDLRKGKGKLRILLPSVLNYRAIHRIYLKSSSESSSKQVEYLSFIRIWQELVPHICFNKPRSDLCMTCENFKKTLNQITSDLNRDRENEKILLHQQAIEHLEYAKKERDYYRKCIKLAEKSYSKLGPRQKIYPCKPNSRPILMHYSWDFSQQLLYPYEDQQVGPIYFKTPRRAQLFGVCCEGVPRQVNYLIDEADFLEKNSNTVISLLDHFFSSYGLGEKHAFLTADNCVGQNKNNAVLHYLIYRTLIGLHEKIKFSFMVVGHTKFGPDGYFGIIKYRYRRSGIYTYDQLANVIKKSSEQNICQGYRDDNGSEIFEYRDWSNWLLKYFKKLPKITKYHHFYINSKQPGVVIVKETIDGPEEKFMLLKNKFPYSDKRRPQLPERIKPSGLSLERSWYLYNEIRDHIPSIEEKNKTCPLPKCSN